MGAAPPGDRGPAGVAGAGGREQDLRHCLPDPAGGRHRRVPHPGALGALRLGALPGEGALRGADEELPPDLPQRHDLSGQDFLPRVQPERQGLHQPDPGVPGRGVPPPDLRHAGNLPPGGLALRAGRGWKTPLQGGGVQRDEGVLRLAGHPDPERDLPPAVPGHQLPLRLRRGPGPHPGTDLRALFRLPPAVLPPLQRLYLPGRPVGPGAGAVHPGRGVPLRLGRRRGAARLCPPAAREKRPGDGVLRGGRRGGRPTQGPAGLGPGAGGLHQSGGADGGPGPGGGPLRRQPGPPEAGPAGPGPGPGRSPERHGRHPPALRAAGGPEH